MHVQVHDHAAESAREIMVALLEASPAAELETEEYAAIQAGVTAPLSYSPLMRATGRGVQELLENSLRHLRIIGDECGGMAGGVADRSGRLPGGFPAMGRFGHAITEVIMGTEQNPGGVVRSI
jgi:hypothetical protein